MFFDPPYYQATFSGMSANDLSTYLKAITNVKVADTEYTRATSFWNASSKFKTYVVNDAYGTSVHDCLQMTLDAFSTTANTIITISAEGYADLTFTVDKNGALVPADDGQDETAVLDLAHTGIVSVSGVNYASIVLTSEAEDISSYEFYLSGQKWFDATPVNTAGTIFKLELPDDTNRTLAVYKDGAPVQIITLGAIGNCASAAAKTVDDSLVKQSRAPYSVLTKETIPLTQYLMFIESNAPGCQADGLWIYPTTTTVNADFSTVQTLAFDAKSSATEQGEVEFEGQTKEATIAVLFDMIANNKIATALDIAPVSSAALVAKWDSLEKGIALNEDASLYAEQLGDVIDTPISDAVTPKYVKYLTASCNYGTKVSFATHKPDSRTAPQISIADAEIYNNITATLSEENETWLLYLTEISIPYTASKTYHYLDGASIADDNLSITLLRNYVSGMYAGPTEYVGDYTATFKSVGFEDVSADFAVLNAGSALTINQTWNDANECLILDTKYDSSTYFSFDFKSLYINGTDCTESVTASGYYTLSIPYALLKDGENTIRIVADGWADQTLTVTYNAPEPTEPQGEVALTVNSASEGSKTFNVTVSGADDAWWDALTASAVTVKQGSSSTWKVASIEADKAASSFTVTGSYGLSSSSTYTLTVETLAGFESSGTSFKPTKPISVALQTLLQEDGSLLITQNSYASYLGRSQLSFWVNGTQLTSAQYTQSYDSEIGGNGYYYVLIHADVLSASGDYVIELRDTLYETYQTTVTVQSASEPETPSIQLIGNALSGSKTVSFDLTDSAWYTQINKDNTALAYATSYGSYDVSLGDVHVDAEQGTLSVTTGYSALSASNTYTLTISVDGYDPITATFRPYSDAGTNTAVFNGDGTVTVTADSSSNYFLSNASKLDVYVNDVKINADLFTSDYNSQYCYLIKIDASVFPTAGEYSIRIENTSTSNYLPWSGNVVVTEIQDAPILALSDGSVSAESTSVCISVDDLEWLAAVEQNNVSLVSISSYGWQYNETISDVITDLEAGTLTITVRSYSAFSSSYTYEVKISQAGYKDASISFKPV